MIVSRVELLQLQLDDIAQRCRGIVRILAGHEKVVLTCDIDYPPTSCQKDLEAALTMDAFRQLKRMPEFRSGASPLEINKYALI